MSRKSLSALTVVTTVLTVVAAVALDPFLRAWVGADIASSSAPVGEILLIGMWVNCLAVVPFAFLQARGRPDLPAKLHLLEVGPYIGGLIIGLHLAGIQGAAWAWSGRAAADAVLLFWAARNVSKGTALADWRELVGGSMFAIAACVASLTIFDALSVRLVVGGGLVIGCLIWAWRIAPAQARLHLLRRRLS